MNRRKLMTSGAMSILAYAGFSQQLMADGPPVVIFPEDSKAKKKKKKTSGKVSVPTTAVGIITTCVTGLRILCRQIQADMAIINNVYKSMLNDTARRLKSKKLTAGERANILALQKKLMSEYNNLLELSTGKSAKFVPQGKKNISDNFCKKAEAYLKAATTDRKAYAKTKSKSTKKSRAKSARKNLSTASRIMRDALDKYTKRANRNHTSLKKAKTAAGTKDIYTKAREAKITAARKRLMNRTQDIFNANRKIDGLRPFTR